MREEGSEALHSPKVQILSPNSKPPMFFTQIECRKPSVASCGFKRSRFPWLRMAWCGLRPQEAAFYQPHPIHRRVLIPVQVLGGRLDGNRVFWKKCTKMGKKMDQNRTAPVRFLIFFGSQIPAIRIWLPFSPPHYWPFPAFSVSISFPPVRNESGPAPQGCWREPAAFFQPKFYNTGPPQGGR